MNTFTNKTLVALFSASITIVSLVGHAQSTNSNLSASEYVDLIEGYSHQNVIKPIYFDSGKAVIRDDEFKKLEQLINLYSGKESLSVVFVGHTDNQHLSEKSQSVHKDNFELSQNRAQRVMSEFNNYLGKNGNVNLTYAGMGPKQPVASNESQQGMSLNRRVEVHFIYSTKEDLRSSLATINSYSAKRGNNSQYQNAAATYTLDANADTHYVKAGEMAKLESIALNNCVENCDNLEAIDGPVVIENQAAVNTIDQVISLPANSLSSKKAEVKQAVNTVTVKAETPVLVKPEASKEIAALSKTDIKTAIRESATKQVNVAVLSETKAAPAVKQAEVKASEAIDFNEIKTTSAEKTETQKEIASLSKAEVKQIVREQAVKPVQAADLNEIKTASAVKAEKPAVKQVAELNETKAAPAAVKTETQAAELNQIKTASEVKADELVLVKPEAPKEVAVLTKPEVKQVAEFNETKAAPVMKQIAVKSETTKEVVTLTKPVAKPIVREQAAKPAQAADFNEIKTTSAVKTENPVAVKSATQKEVASLSKAEAKPIVREQAVKQVAIKTEAVNLKEIKTASTATAEKPVLVKPEASKEIAALPKTEVKTVVREPATKQVNIAEFDKIKPVSIAKGEKPLTVKTEAQKEVATLTKPVAKSMVRARAVKPASKQVAVKSVAQKEVASLSKSVAKSAVRTKAVEQKETKTAAAAKAKSSSKAACGGYAYGGCYDLALKSDFKFREALTIEATPATKVASLSKAAAKSRLVQKVVVKQATKKSLALSKPDATATLKEFSRSKASREVSEKSAQLAMNSFTALRKIEVKEEIKKEVPVVEVPVREVPVKETPVVKTPVIETPVVKTPVVKTPVVKTPVIKTPVVAVKR